MDKSSAKGDGLGEEAAALGFLFGVPLAHYALSHAPVGMAATLMFIAPVFLLP